MPSSLTTLQPSAEAGGAGETRASGRLRPAEAAGDCSVSGIAPENAVTRLFAHGAIDGFTRSIVSWFNAMHDGMAGAAPAPMQFGAILLLHVRRCCAWACQSSERHSPTGGAETAKAGQLQLAPPASNRHRPAATTPLYTATIARLSFCARNSTIGPSESGPFINDLPSKPSQWRTPRNPPAPRARLPGGRCPGLSISPSSNTSVPNALFLPRPLPAVELSSPK